MTIKDKYANIRLDGSHKLLPNLWKEKCVMNFDFGAILDKINIEEIMAKITEILAKIDFQAILNKIIEFITGLIK